MKPTMGAIGRTLKYLGYGALALFVVLPFAVRGVGIATDWGLSFYDPMVKDGTIVIASADGYSTDILARRTDVLLSGMIAVGGMIEAGGAGDDGQLPELAFEAVAQSAPGYDRAGRFDAYPVAAAAGVPEAVRRLAAAVDAKRTLLRDGASDARRYYLALEAHDRADMERATAGLRRFSTDAAARFQKLAKPDNVVAQGMTVVRYMGAAQARLSRYYDGHDHAGDVPAGYDRVLRP